MHDVIKYFEVLGPGMNVIKRFRDRENAEAFASQEREKRMEDLESSDEYTHSEKRGEATYRTYGIIVKSKQIEFCDKHFASKASLDFWANVGSRNFPPGF
jgi:hypothetical protein